MLSNFEKYREVMMAEAPPSSGGGEAHGGGGKAHGGKGGHKKSGGHGEGGHGEGVNLERWLVSYADFMTLLFCVFTVLYAMSISDKQKVQEVARSVTKALGLGGPHEARMESSKDLDRGDVFDGTEGILDKSGKDIIPDLTYKRVSRRERVDEPVDNDFSAPGKGGVAGEAQQEAKMEQVANMMAESLGKVLDQATADQIAIKVTPGVGVRIVLPEQITFDSGAATIKPAFAQALKQIANVIDRVDNRVLIEGHTDNVPMRTERFASNWELSTARATQVLHLIVSRYRLNPRRFSAAGYGEYHPLASNESALGRSKNRRVEIIIQEKK
ncbi:MAG: flagellar motor protein MotB [Oligoflexia bacterium]|nr:flagellar motor protein MotB [Oligoflexia bacterium]MBF0365159.1 flagellar motor protein MotB [Oligoflexia bacterium]